MQMLARADSFFSLAFAQKLKLPGWLGAETFLVGSTQIGKFMIKLITSVFIKSNLNSFINLLMKDPIDPREILHKKVSNCSNLSLVWRKKNKNVWQKIHKAKKGGAKKVEQLWLCSFKVDLRSVFLLW